MIFCTSETVLSLYSVIFSIDGYFVFCQERRRASWSLPWRWLFRIRLLYPIVRSFQMLRWRSFLRGPTIVSFQWEFILYRKTVCFAANTFYHSFFRKLSEFANAETCETASGGRHSYCSCLLRRSTYRRILVAQTTLCYPRDFFYHSTKLFFDAD